MARSGTWSKLNYAKSQLPWFAFAYWLTALFYFPLPVLAQSKTQLGDLPFTTRTGVFFVHSTAPFRFPTQFQSAPHSLSAEQIGQLAAGRCGAANLVLADSKSRSQHSISQCKDFDCEKEILNSFQAAIACRLRQTASANAMKLHYGVATCLEAQRIFDETYELIHQQERAQAELVEKGVPIPDPLLVGRLKIILDDKQLENQSKILILRRQLSALIGTEYACDHTPDEDNAIVPSDRSACDYIQQALSCRCDLLTMKRLRGTINAESLEVWHSIGAILSGVPTFAKPNSFWLKILKAKRNQTDIQCAIALRRRWLDDLILERAAQIVMEIEVAFEKKRTAALRWVNSGEQISNWETRIAQLEQLSEVQGNLAIQWEAKLDRLQSKGQRIERWMEWQQANVDLKLAIGCDL